MLIRSILCASGVLLLAVAGCPTLPNQDSVSPSGSANINGDAEQDIPAGNENTNSADVPTSTTRALLLVHGRPTDGYSAINVSVSEVEFIGGGGPHALTTAARVNLLSESTSAFLVCLDDAPVGEFTKLRLTISDPEFIEAGGTAISGSQVRVLAGGKLDLNGKNDKIDIRAGMTNVIELNVADEDNALKINRTGNGMYSLRSEITVTPRNAASAPIEFAAAIVLSLDAGDGPGDTDENLIEVFVGQCELIVALTPSTVVDDAVGDPGSINDIVKDAALEIIGRYDAARDVLVADHVVILQ